MEKHGTIKLNPDDLLFIPLGGCEQFGLNFNLYAYGGKFLGVDCGIGFADERFPGVDILLPDPLFIEERAKDLLGIFITHAHEDHVGAVPYLWSRLKCPIYCTPFVASFLRRKCAEFGDVKGMVINEVNPDQIVKVGPFTVGILGVTHSTPSTISLTIDTPKGLIVHGNEWNLDPTPKAALLTNREGFKAAGRKGVLAYVGDSTNAPYSGTSIGEEAVQDGLERAFAGCTGRICVTMFASNVGRILSIAKAAKKVGRSVCLAGRSLHNYVGIAIEHRMMRDVPPFLEPKEAAGLAPNRIVYIVTGSQGEPRAALARIANGDYRDIRLQRGDTVVFSSRAIPGNERHLNMVKGDLLASGIQIIDADNTPRIHATGHPYRDEIAQMFDWVKPRIVVAIHGERLHLEAQVDLARSKQVPFSIVPENGSVIRLSDDGPMEIDQVPVGILAVEPSRVIATDHPALKERRLLQNAGALHVTVVLQSKGNHPLAAPVQVSGAGLFDSEDPEDTVIQKDIANAISTRVGELLRHGRPQDPNYLQEELRQTARRVVNDAMGLKPKTSVHVVMI